jgi:replicative DNA helicase
MDLELRFISSLLGANRNEQSAYFQNAIPESIFNIRAKEIHWLYTFWRENKRLPTRSSFEARFRLSCPKSTDILKVSAQSVIDSGLFQNLKRVVETLKRNIDKGESMSDVVAYARRAVNDLQIFAPTQDDIQFGQTNLALNRYRELVRLLSADDQSMLIDTPWPTCNKLINFYQAGALIGLVARPYIGKTHCICNWAHHLMKKGTKSLFISKEMLSEQVLDRLEALEYELSFPDLKSGNLPPKELRRWLNARKKGLKYDFIISGDETLHGVGLDHVAQKIDQYKPQVVFIDGAYLLRVEGLSKSAQGNERLREMTSRFKAMAKALKIVLIVVFQVNRKGVEKGVSGGDLDTIYGTDTLGQDADGVFVLKGEPGAPNRLFKVAKGRDGNTGEFMINFDLSPPDFSELGPKFSAKSQNNKFKFKGIS